MWDLESDTNELLYKTETDTYIEDKLAVTKRERRGKSKLRVWDYQIQTTLYKKKRLTTRSYCIAQELYSISCNKL